MGDTVCTKMTIDTALVPTKVLYFLYYAGLASFIPYKSIFQKQLGMSPSQNGLIQATMQLVSLLSPPIAGILTDKTKAYKLIMSVCLFFSIAFTIPFYFVPKVERETTFVVFPCCEGTNATELECLSMNNKTVSMNCTSLNGSLTEATSKIINLTATANCQNATTEVECTTTDSNDVYSITFATLVVLTALMSFFLAPVTPLTDACAMDILGINRISEFGVQRLWGAVGFGLVGLVVSYITDLVSPKDVYGDEDKNYIPAFTSATFCWLLTIVVASMLRITSPKAKSVLRGVGRLLKQARVLAFLVVVFVSGYSTGIQYSYLFWYLMSLKDFSQTILGLSLLVTCCSEIPMFYISGWICNKLGYVSVLSLGLIAVSARFLMYAVITTAWQVLLVEWLHGVSFALPMAAMCSYAAVIAPSDTIATLMSLSQTVYWGLGNMAGALLGGVLYHMYGGSTTFKISGILCAVVSLIYWLLLGPFDLMSRFCPQVQKEEKKKPDEIPNKANCAEKEPLNIQEDVV